MLSTTANPTDGLRFDGSADSVAEGDVHPKVYRGSAPPKGVGNGTARKDIRQSAKPTRSTTCLLKPGLSDILPSEADIRTHVTRAIPLNIPIIASAMDTVTEARMAIAMAQAGGIGVIHRNFDPEGQAAQVRQVKKYQIRNGGQSADHRSGCQLVGRADADEGPWLFRHSGGHRRRQGHAGQAGRHSTNRDVRFATNPNQKISELMTHENLVTVREGVSQDEAKRMLHKHRIEKLLVVDDQYRCVGLITVKDMEKAVAHPLACKDAQGRLRVAAATTVGEGGFERTEWLIDAGVDLVVVDTAHGHSLRVLEAVNRIKRLSNAVQVDCRQRRDQGRRAGADRFRRGRHQGRHRSGLDLHHAHRRRRRRAAAHRDHGCGRSRARRRTCP